MHPVCRSMSSSNGCSSRRPDKVHIGAKLLGKLHYSTRLKSNADYTTRFNLFHAEKLPSAQKRYVDEIHRVVGVLDGVLGQSEDGWLVGNKVTYADLAFVTWHTALAGIFSPPEFKDQWDITKYAHYKKWVEKMLDRPAVKKVLEEQQRLVAESS